MLIGHGEDMTLLVLNSLGQKVVTRVTFVTKCKHALMIGLGGNTIPDVLKFTRSKVKVTWVIFVISYVNSFYFTS